MCQTERGPPHSASHEVWSEFMEWVKTKQLLKEQLTYTGGIFALLRVVVCLSIREWGGRRRGCNVAGPGKCSTGVELILGSKVQCLFCFEICTTEGREGEKGGSANFKTKHT